VSNNVMGAAVPLSVCATVRSAGAAKAFVAKPPISVVVTTITTSARMDIR
jgi:hypothetical protein